LLFVSSLPPSCLVLGHVILLYLRTEATRANSGAGVLVQRRCKDSRNLAAISIEPESLLFSITHWFSFFSTVK